MSIYLHLHPRYPSPSSTYAYYMQRNNSAVEPLKKKPLRRPFPIPSFDASTMVINGQT